MRDFLLEEIQNRLDDIHFETQCKHRMKYEERDHFLLGYHGVVRLNGGRQGKYFCLSDYRDISAMRKAVSVFLSAINFGIELQKGYYGEGYRDAESER